MAMKKKANFAGLKWIDISSSTSVKRIAYDKDTKRLFVTWANSENEGYYDNVPAKLFNELTEANSSGQSVGSLLHALIKAEPKKYPYTPSIGGQ